MKAHSQSGREPTEQELREAERVLSLGPVQQKNHPSSVAADHSKLSHINTYGRLPDYYLDRPFTAASAASGRFGKPQTRSGIMRRPRGTLMPLRLSAAIVVT